MSSYTLPPILTISLILALTPAPANAQEQTDAQSEAYQQMLDLSDRATEAILNDDFEIAAVKFRLAYRAFPDPILLKNEMIAWYRADDCRSALSPAQNFLKSDDVQPEDRRDVQTVQTDCHLRLAEEAIAQNNTLIASHHLDSLTTLPLDKKNEARHQEHRQALDELSTPLDLSQKSDHVQAQTTLIENPNFGWAQIATGIAVAGAGAALHAVYVERSAQLAQFERSDDLAAQIVYDTRKQEWEPFFSTGRWAIPSLYALGALTIGSGTFFLLRNTTADTTIAPSASPNQMGLIISGQF